MNESNQPPPPFSRSVAVRMANVRNRLAQLDEMVVKTPELEKEHAQLSDFLNLHISVYWQDLLESYLMAQQLHPVAIQLAQLVKLGNDIMAKQTPVAAPAIVDGSNIIPIK